MKVIASCGNSFGLGSFSSYEEDVTINEGRRLSVESKPGDFLGVGFASSALYAQDDTYVIVHTRDNPSIDHSMSDRAQARYLLGR